MFLSLDLGCGADTDQSGACYNDDCRCHIPVTSEYIRERLEAEQALLKKRKMARPGLRQRITAAAVSAGNSRQYEALKDAGNAIAALVSLIEHDDECDTKSPCNCTRGNRIKRLLGDA